MRSKAFVIALTFAVTLSIPFLPQVEAQTAKAPIEDHAAAVAALKVEPIANAYMIGPDDVLAINVWKEPEISRTLPVRPDGNISLPLINDVQAAGMTPTELASEIAEKLRKVIVSPQVTVIVTQINSRRIYILGEVARAGAYP